MASKARHHLKKPPKASPDQIGEDSDDNVPLSKKLSTQKAQIEKRAEKEAKRLRAEDKQQKPAKKAAPKKVKKEESDDDDDQPLKKKKTPAKSTKPSSAADKPAKAKSKAAPVKQEEAEEGGEDEDEVSDRSCRCRFAATVPKCAWLDRKILFAAMPRPPMLTCIILGGISLVGAAECHRRRHQEVVDIRTQRCRVSTALRAIAQERQASL